MKEKILIKAFVKGLEVGEVLEVALSGENKWLTWETGGQEETMLFIILKYD